MSQMPDTTNAHSIQRQSSLLSRGKILTAALNADPVKSGQAYDVPAISQGYQFSTTTSAIQMTNNKKSPITNINGFSPSIGLVAHYGL